MNFTLVIDKFMANEVRFLAPHYSALDMSAPRKMSRHMKFPKPVWANISNWFYHEDKPATEEEQDEMVRLFG